MSESISESASVRSPLAAPERVPSDLVPAPVADARDRSGQEHTPAKAVTLPGPYQVTLHETFDQVQESDWERVTQHLTHPYMDPRFLRATVRTLGKPIRYWFAQFTTASGEPVAAACFSLFPSDGSLFLSEGVQKRVESVRRWWPSFFKFNVLLQGMPVTTGESGLAYRAGMDLPQLLRQVDEISCRLALKHGANFISVKELDEPACQELSYLTEIGYRRADSALTWTMANEFRDFPHYYDSRTKRTRANMRKVFKKFEEAGLQSRHLRGRSDRVDELFTDEVHQLYMAVFRRAHIKFEVLPAEFFREVARQLGDDSHWTFFYDGDRIVGFVLGIHHAHMHYMLLCGVDYQINDKTDLYFNLLYKALEAAISTGSPWIRVGASADEFKMRMGTFPKPLYFYIKSPRAWVRAILNRAFLAIFPPFSPSALQYLARAKEEAAGSDGVEKAKSDSAVDAGG